MSVIIRIFNLFLVAEEEEKGDYDVLDHNRPMPQVRPHYLRMPSMLHLRRSHDTLSEMPLDSEDSSEDKQIHV